MMSSTFRSGLTLHTSNRFERLADQLSKLIADPLRSPLLPEIIVVQSNGMRRWLEQQIADRHGICSNVQFPFPQKFFHDLLQSAFPQSEATNLFDQEVMTWRIMKDLPRLASRPDFAAVANYLRGERTELRAYELARRIAHVFDQYVVFRPKMILDWDTGEGKDWQPMLWRELQRAGPGARLDLRGLDSAPVLYLAHWSNFRALSGPSFCDGTDAALVGRYSFKTGKSTSETTRVVRI